MNKLLVVGLIVGAVALTGCTMVNPSSPPSLSQQTGAQVGALALGVETLLPAKVVTAINQGTSSGCGLVTANQTLLQLAAGAADEFGAKGLAGKANMFITGLCSAVSGSPARADLDEAHVILASYKEMVPGASKYRHGYGADRKLRRFRNITVHGVLNGKVI